MSGTPSDESSSGRGPLLLAGALFALVLAVAVLLLGRTAERGAFAEEYSSFRATPGGAKAAYLVLERLGYPVRRHTEELVALEGIDVLVVLEPAVSGGGLLKSLFDERETRALELYVRDGGCLVVASSIETPLHGAFGVRLENARSRLLSTPIGSFVVGTGVGGAATSGGPGKGAGAGPVTPVAFVKHKPGVGNIFGVPDDEEPEPDGATPVTATTAVVPALPSLYAEGVRTLLPDEHRRSLLPETATAVPLFRREGGAHPEGGTGIEAVAVRAGRGRAIFFADPSIFGNRAIGRADNAMALVAIAAAHVESGVVAFDEAHHGFASERGMTGYLGRRSLAPAIVQAGLAFFVLAVALGGRRGRPPLTLEERPPESIEHVKAMAEIYGKARLHGHVAQRLYVSLVRDAEMALGFVATVRADRQAGMQGSQDGPVTEALRERGVKGFRMLESISARYHRMIEAPDPRKISEHDLLLLAREIGRFEADCRRAFGQRFGSASLGA